MENFNELFAKAQEVSDCRKKVFGELVDKAQNELIPAFCRVMESFDINTCFFRLSNKPTEYNEADKDEEGNEYYVLALRKDGMFNDAKYDLYVERYHVPESWSWQLFADKPIKRTAILELVKLLNSRLADYVKKYEAKNEEAKGILNE